MCKILLWSGEQEPNTVKCHYNACHYNANASLTRSILGSQTVPSWPSPSGSAHGQKVWNHRRLIGHSGNDIPLFPCKWNKTKVSHLLVMSIQSIHDWSSIKHTDYSSPVLRECHHRANMAAKCLDVENNPGSNQFNISQTHINWHNRDWQIMLLDPNRVIRLITACKDIAQGIIIAIFCMDSVRFKSWKDFSLGWWNALASAWFPGVRHFENLTLWIQLRFHLRGRAWKATNGHSQKLAQLSMTIFSKFWLRDRYPICIHCSWPCCFTCIAEQVTSKVVDFFSRTGRPLACQFANTNLEMTKFVRSARKTMFYYIVDTGRVISNHRDSSHVGSCQLTVCGVDFADFTSADRFDFNRLYSTSVTKYGVYNSDKYFSRNKWLCQLWIIVVWGRIYLTKLGFPNITHDPSCLKTSQNTPIANPAAITRWPL